MSQPSNSRVGIRHGMVSMTSSTAMPTCNEINRRRADATIGSVGRTGRVPRMRSDFTMARPDSGPPLCDEMRGGAQDIGFRAERVQADFGFRDQLDRACAARRDPSTATSVALPAAASLPVALPSSGRVAFDIEQIVGDLERLADRAAIAVERLAHAG